MPGLSNPQNTDKGRQLSSEDSHFVQIAKYIRPAMGDHSADVSDFMTVHQEDLDKRRFQLCWSCTEGYRQDAPVRLHWNLADGNRHLTVTLNDVIYFSDELPAEAAAGDSAVQHKIKHLKTLDKVFIVIEKREKGNWIS